MFKVIVMRVTFRTNAVYKCISMVGVVVLGLLGNFSESGKKKEITNERK